VIETYSPLKHWEFLRFWEHVWPRFDIDLTSALEEKVPILPDRKNWFKALELVKPKDVKCVILGQDPYPTRGHAHGLSFSVQPHVRPLPGSLNNILREYKDDLGYPTPGSGDLTPWAQKGVLLLNSILTVEEGKPLSHEGMGWEKLTYEIIRVLADRGDVVFVLWGKRAQEYTAACGDCPVVTGVHPSPKNNFRGGFLGSRPFSQVNDHLTGMNRMPIQWRLP
jgi:uracil-DNA glycosylase